MANVYQTGSSVLLKANFTDLYEEPTNTDSLPIVTIYDRNFHEIATLTSEQESQGTYKTVYTIPDGIEETVYYYEFKGTLAGVVGLDRGKFFVKFSNEELV